MSLGHILALEMAATVGYAAICLANNGALYGWLSTVSRKEDENQLSACLTVSNIGGSGVMAVLGGAIVRRLDLAEAALVLVAMDAAPRPDLPVDSPPRDRTASSPPRASAGSGAMFSRFFGQRSRVVQATEPLGLENRALRTSRRRLLLATVSTRHPDGGLVRAFRSNNSERPAFRKFIPVATQPKRLLN